MPTDSWTTKEGDEICEGCHDCCGNCDYDDACDECREHRDDNCGFPYEHNIKPKWSTKIGGVELMNTTIAKLFEKTVDAMLVNKFFGHQIAQNEVAYITLNGKQKELLASAQALQAKQDVNANVVTARIVA